MWLRFGCLGMLLSCSPTEGTESIADIAFYLLLAATVGWIWWRDRVRVERIADYLGEDQKNTFLLDIDAYFLELFDVSPQGVA